MLALIFALLVSAPSHAYVVISDLDDTIKITQSDNNWTATWNGVFSSKVFAGMPTYLRAPQPGRSAFYVVTGSWSLAQPRIRSLFKKFGLKVTGLYTRDNMGEGTFDYKVKRINKILAKHPGEDLVFLGDDVGHDHNVYEHFKQTLEPGRVKAIYIRTVKNRPLPPSQIPYVTAYDIAANEALAGRFPWDALPDVAGVITRSPAKYVIPHFSWCPQTLSHDYPTATFPAGEAMLVQEKVEGICR